MKNTKLIYRILGIAGLLISVILIIRFSLIVEILIDFSEKNISRDNYIQSEKVSDIGFIVIFFIILTIIASLFIILDLKRKFSLFANTYFQTNQAKEIFLIDTICAKTHLSKYILVIGTLFGIFLLLLGEPRYEGFLEKFTTLLLLISAIILIISSCLINKKLYPTGTIRKIIFILLVISGVLLLIFGEEISWGQRIFGWESSGVFIEYNYQNETNIHNFFNPIYKYIYKLVGVISFSVLVFMWFFPKNKKTYVSNLFFPHASLFFLVFIMAGSSFSGANELFEELFAVFVLLYSFRIFMCLRYPTIDKNKYQ